MMEDHDRAYYAWKQAGIHGRILLHIDAHIDWDWILDRDPLELLQAESLRQVESLLKGRCLWNLSDRKHDDLVHIGNYIWPAIQQGIVRELYWLIPDSIADNPRSWKEFLRELQPLAGDNPWQLRNIRQENRRIIADIAGVTLTTCTLSDLPPMEEGVLLDIDTDFLTAQPAAHMGGEAVGDDLWRQLPWIWPEELIERLNAKRIRTDFVTIAYSVEGGYTPLCYKYLGEELALRLKHPVLPERDRRVIAHKRKGAGYRSQTELENASAEFEAAAALAPGDASTHFNLAYLDDAQQAYAQAAVHYRQAIQLDPSYATAYNNFGSVYYSLGSLEKARQEYERILRWDPQAVDAHFGLAEVLDQQERWNEAISRYQKVVEVRPDHAGAHCALGRLHAKHGRWEEATSALSRSLAVNPHDSRVYGWLGDAYFHQNHWDKAIEAYRGALRCGMRTVAIYVRLGGLYLRKGRFYRAFTQYRKGLRLQGWLILSAIRERSRALFETVSERGSRVHVRHPACQEREDPLAHH
jgi:tetratricopeptide (TPR) repeat protein